MQVRPDEWYTLISIAIIAIWVLIGFAQCILSITISPISYFLRRHIFYRIVWNRRPFSHTINRSGAIARILYIAANLAPLALRVKNWEEAAARNGRLATVNIIFLLVCTNLGFATRFLRVTAQTQSAIHSWIGVVALLEATVHSTIRGFLSGWRWGGGIVSCFMNLHCNQD